MSSAAATTPNKEYPCKICNKKFKSQSACRQHFVAVHRHHTTESLPRVIDPTTIDPPVDSPGQWVEPSAFQGKKSFGFFHCPKCEKEWMSAHAFPKYRQGCKACEEESYPVFLWVNLHKNGQLEKKEGKLEGPHDSERCEACAAGECKRN